MRPVLVKRARRGDGSSPRLDGSALRPDRTRNRRAIAGFVGPFAVLFAALYLVPIGYAIYQSLLGVVRDGAYGSAHTVFAGLDQYQRVLENDEFISSIGRVLLLGVVQVPVMIALATIFALLLDSPLVKAKAFFRLGFFAPFAVPTVVAAIMWTFLYSPSLSPVSWLTQTVDFLGPGLVLWSVGNIGMWLYTGWVMLIVYSALQAIPQETYEAARVDGAGQLRIAWSIKVPMVLPTLILTGVFTIIGVFQLFNEPTVLQSGTGAVPNDFTPNMVVYATSAIPNYHLAAATSVVLALVTAVVSFGFLKVTQRRSFQ
jgi:multiple sugar transport system permease protein